MSAPGNPGWAPAMAGALLPPLEGTLGWAGGGRVQGWLRDPARPLWPVSFALMRGAGCLLRCTAAQPLGEGRHGFTVHLPPDLAAGLPGLLDEVHLVEPGSGRVLARAVTAAPAQDAPVLPHIQPVPGPPAPPPPVSGPDPVAPVVPVPTDPVALRSAVEAAFQASDWSLVLHLTERAVRDLGPRAEHRMVSLRGRAFLYQRRFAEAAETLAWFQQRMPQHHLALFFLAQALAGLQRLEESWAVFAACLALQPDEPRYVLEAARVAVRLVNGDYGALEPRPELLPEALALLRRSTVLSSEDPRPWRELGHLLLQTEAVEEGIAALERAGALAPDQAVPQLDLARALTRLGRLEPALAAARAALAREPQRDGAAFAVRLLERWAEARRAGPFSAAIIGPED